MRQILFKAKRADNGEWAEGCLLYRMDGVFIGWQEDTPMTLEDPCGSFEWIEYQVNQDTVCQLTPLADKNNREIWEGDIVMDGNTKWIVVEWMGCFQIEKMDESQDEKNDSAEYLWNYNLVLEVIGSIHDNPDTLNKHTP